MKQFIQMIALAGLMSLMALTAQAGCFADYKAKQDDPLKLHYGVIELPDTACESIDDAGLQIADRIGVDDWILLKVLAIFDEDGLEQRKERAGNNYLRY